jgi:hypothetical protein
VNIDDRENIAEYSVDDGSIIEHNPQDGAIALAIKLLQTIKEPQEAELTWQSKKKIMSMLSNKKHETLENE